MDMYKNPCFIACLFLFISCEGKKPENTAFYYWKTSYRFDEKDKHLANEIGVNKFYIRYFDVDWSATRKEAIPVGTLQFEWDEKMPVDFVPCVFITNMVMLKSTETQLDSLVIRMKGKIEAITANIFQTRKYEYEAEPDSVKNKIKDEYTEIQIDCDWTPNSKNNYFYFLKKFKSVFPDKKISATLRLWQFKYQEKAGIPPVDKVMLMCYSLGNPKEYNIQNSIATFDEIEKYIKDQKYSMPVDIALPIFNWGVMFRNKKFKGIIGDLNSDAIKSDSVHYNHIEANRYSFKYDTVIGNSYIRFGDEIRLESLEHSDLKKVIKLIRKSGFYNEKSTISFFSWDTTYINQYGKENIKNYYKLFN